MSKYSVTTHNWSRPLNEKQIKTGINLKGSGKSGHWVGSMGGTDSLGGLSAPSVRLSRHGELQT